MDTNAAALDAQLITQVQHIRPGDKQALADVLEKHVRQHPENTAFALLLVASQLAQNGQFADAIPLYIEVLRLKPADPAIYFYLGLAYHGLNLYPESRQIWDELPKRFPGHALADYQAALRLIDDQQVIKAKPLLEQALGKLDEGSAMRIQIMSTLDVVRSGGQIPS